MERFLLFYNEYRNNYIQKSQYVIIAVHNGVYISEIHNRAPF